jgi:hypothetical protein
MYPYLRPAGGASTIGMSASLFLPTGGERRGQIATHDSEHPVGVAEAHKRTTR